MTEIVALSGLTATGGVSQIALTWDVPADPNVRGLPYLRLEAVEVWASATNDRDTATQIGEQSTANSFVHTGVEQGSTYYYWIRPRLEGRDSGGQPVYGDWYPASSTGGVVGEESTQVEIVVGRGGGYWILPPNGGLIIQWGTDQTEIGDYVTINFPIPFPNVCMHLAARRENIDIDYELIAEEAVPVTSFQAASYETGDQTDAPITWFAIGY